MNILSYGMDIENCENNIFEVHDSSLEAELAKAGCQRLERVYQVKYQHKVYTVQCPEYVDEMESGHPTWTVIPAFLVPGRPYPLCVYLHAIDLYSANPEKGQRWAAAATRKHFGLETFSHTTLGRALKRFITVIGNAINNADEQGEERASETYETEHTCQKSDNDGIGFPSVHLTAALRKRAAQFLGGIFVGTSYQEAASISQDVARWWYLQYRRLLL